MSTSMGSPIRAHLANSRAQASSYRMPTEAYTGPDSGGASYQKGNMQSTAFVFESKQLRQGATTPLAHGIDSSTSLLGSRAGSSMGQNPLNPSGE